MISIEKLKSYINRMQRQGDQQSMRNAVQVMAHHFGMTVATFANLQLSSMVQYIEGYVTDVQRANERATGKVCLIPTAMHAPEKLARAIRMGFVQLAQQFPDQGFPEVAATPDPHVHPYVCDPTKPLPRLQREMQGWNPRLRNDKSGIGTGAPMIAKTQAEYRTKVWQIVTFWVTAGMTVGQSFGIEFMTNPKCVAVWLPRLQAHYSEKGHAPILAALKRVAADLLGADHRNVVALEAVQRNASKKGQNKGLCGDEVEELRDMVRPHTTASYRQIWDAPAMIDASAQRRRLSAADQDSRKSCAVAADILLSTVCIAPMHLANLHLKDDINDTGEIWKVRCTDHNGTVSWRPLSQAGRDRIVALKRFRVDIGRPSPWLFPSKHCTGPQTRQIAMTALARHLSAALRRNTTVTDLTDAVLVNLIDNGTNDAKIIGTVAGTDPRTVRRRLAIPLDTPLPPEESAA